MNTLRLVALASWVGALLLSAACGDDDAVVRERLDSGVDAAPADAGDGGALACGVAIPTSYESAGFDDNARIEQGLRARFEEIGAKMKATEGASDAGVTAAELKAIYGEGSPSLRAVSTNAAQATIDAYFDDYGAIMGQAWEPKDADGDGGDASGGKYGDFYFSKTGVDLREATAKVLLGGALYNHVLGIVSAPMTEASVDRLLAAFGASRAFADSTSADAGADKDELIAEYASNRDDEASETPGPYRKMKTALLTMKGAIAGGDKCKADLDAAVATFLLEWERTSFATAIFYLNAASNDAADPAKGPEALHGYGEALGFIQSFKGLPADKRKIQDTQIDALLEKIGAATAYKLVTNAGERVPKLNEAIADIALYEGFTPAEVDGFKR